MEALVWIMWAILVTYTLGGWILERLGVLAPLDARDDLADAIAWDRENPGVIAQPEE